MPKLTKRSVFNLMKKPDPRKAKLVSIKSPEAFRKSIKALKKGRFVESERKSLTLARTRATLQLKRKNLSMKERKQFTKISKMRIPNVK